MAVKISFTHPICANAYRQGLIDSTRRGHATCTVGKILIVAKNNNKCVGRAEWKPL